MDEKSAANTLQRTVITLFSLLALVGLIGLGMTLIEQKNLATGILSIAVGISSLLILFRKPIRRSLL